VSPGALDGAGVGSEAGPDPAPVGDAGDPGDAVGAGVTVDTGVACGAVVGVGAGVGLGVGAGIGFGVGTGVGFGVGLGVGAGVEAGVGAGVGGGGGALMVTVPPAIVPVNLLVSAASKLYACVPAPSFVDHACGTPCFQFELPSPVIACAIPSMITDTWSGAVPLRFRYVTPNRIVVVGCPAVGEADGLNSFVGPSTASTGNARPSTRIAAQSELKRATAGRPAPLRVRRCKCTR
jgi:hypothetical protein